MEITICRLEVRITLEPGMVARFEGGSVLAGGREVARVAVRNFAGGGFDLRPVVEPVGAVVPLSARESLEGVAKWIARHPEALDARPAGRTGVPPANPCWPFMEPVGALAVRERDPVTGVKAWRVIRAAGFRRHPYYRRLAGPAGWLP